MKIGFVGLGAQGGPMAEMIANAGFPLSLWARREETVRPFRDLGAVVVDSLEELGARCDVIGVCVTADDDVDQVLGNDEHRGIMDGAGAGTVVLIHSTVHPKTCQILAQRAAARGVDILDAPVSGGGAAARSRSLTVMVGGDRDALERVLPVLESFGGLVRWVGPIGSGQVCKLVNNALFTAQVVLCGQALQIADSLGIERSTVFDVLSASSARSASLEYLRHLKTENGMWHGRALLTKDIHLLHELVAETDRSETSLLDIALRISEPGTIPGANGIDSPTSES